MLFNRKKYRIKKCIQNKFVIFTVLTAPSIYLTKLQYDFPSLYTISPTYTHEGRNSAKAGCFVVF